MDKIKIKNLVKRSLKWAVFLVVLSAVIQFRNQPVPSMQNQQHILLQAPNKKTLSNEVKEAQLIRFWTMLAIITVVSWFWWQPIIKEEAINSLQTLKLKWRILRVVAFLLMMASIVICMLGALFLTGDSQRQDKITGYLLGVLAVLVCEAGVIMLSKNGGLAALYFLHGFGGPPKELKTSWQKAEWRKRQEEQRERDIAELHKWEKARIIVWKKARGEYFQEPSEEACIFSQQDFNSLLH